VKKLILTLAVVMSMLFTGCVIVYQLVDNTTSQTITIIIPEEMIEVTVEYPQLVDNSTSEAEPPVIRIEIPKIVIPDNPDPPLPLSPPYDIPLPE